MNRRTDEYGGSLANRMRIVTEILAGIRQYCGKDFPVSVRINAEESAPGGIDLAMAVQIAQALEKAGADAINVSCLTAGCIEPGTYQQGWKKYMATAVKKAVSVPVLAVCNIKEPSVAEALLVEGCMDFVGVGRGHLADPDWCLKAFCGKAAQIRKCIGCLACFAEIAQARRIKCCVNPITAREREYAHPTQDGNDRTVAIVGGGPAGIQAAITLKRRGFKPVLFDESLRLGGTLNTADKGYGKEKITRYCDSLIAEIAAAGIETRLGQPATVEAVRALAPCGVFLAVGAEPAIPPIPGIDGANVVTAENVLLRQCVPSGRVAVIGSGMTGLETAEMLVQTCNKLTIVEMLDCVGAGMYHSVVTDVMQRILPHKPDILTGYRLTRVTREGVELLPIAQARTVFVPVDTVVLAMGATPKKNMTEMFRVAFPKAIVIGDARRTGRALEAVQDAQGRAFTFEP